MALMTVQQITPAGVVPSYAAANLQDTINVAGSERVFLHVKNGGGVAVNVTIAAVKTTARVAGAGTLAVPDIEVAIAAGAEKMIGPFDDYYRAANVVTVDYDGVASVTAAAIKLADAS